MSFNENYDKVFLTVGGLLGLAGIGVGALFYMGLDEKYTINDTIRSKEVSLPGIAQSQQLEQAITADHEIKRPQIGAQHFDVFAGPQLWLQKGKVTPIDINEEGAVHPPVPNTWFIENGLQDLLKFSDALTRDPDNDGFTVLEEFEEKTNPNDANSHPLLIKKLVLNGVKRRVYNVAFSSSYPPEFTFRAMTTAGGSLWKQDIHIGDKFGEESTDKDRFVLKEVVQEEFQNESTGVVDKDDVAVVEDLKPTKAGTTYKIRKGNRYPQTILDSTAVFTIVAGSQSGTEFNVEEGLTFKIPGDDKTEYLLKAIDTKSNNVTVTSTIDGRERTWNLKK